MKSAGAVDIRQDLPEGDLKGKEGVRPSNGHRQQTSISMAERTHVDYERSAHSRLRDRDFAASWVAYSRRQCGDFVADWAE